MKAPSPYTKAWIKVRVLYSLYRSLTGEYTPRHTALSLRITKAQFELQALYRANSLVS